MTDALLPVIQAGTTFFDLAWQMSIGMPQSMNHPAFWHTLPRRHGDMVRADGGSAANDMLVTGTHVGTHIDALAHVSHDGELFGGADATDSCIGGKYVEHGVHTIDPMVRRGVLLDIATLKDVECLPGGYEITLADIQDELARTQLSIGAGDVVAIRSGWGSKFREGSAYLGTDSGVPGLGEEAALWLAEHSIHAAGADTIAFEVIRPGVGHGLLPVHRVFLVEHGIYIIEAMNLEALSMAGVNEFTFILIPLNIYGATGSPVRPLAVVSQ